MCQTKQGSRAGSWQAETVGQSQTQVLGPLPHNAGKEEDGNIVVENTYENSASSQVTGTRSTLPNETTIKMYKIHENGLQDIGHQAAKSTDF